MSQLDSNNSEEQNSKSSTILTLLKGSVTNSLMAALLWPIIGTVIAEILVNIFKIEDLPSIIDSDLIILIITLLSTFWGLCFFFSCWNASRIWMNQENHFREAYSVSAFYSMIYLIVIVILGSIFQTMPWTIISVISTSLKEKALTLDLKTGFFEHISLWLILILRLTTYLDAHDRGKNFKKSEQQYQQETESKKINFLEEGWKEFQRRVTQSYQLTPHEIPTIETKISQESWKPILKSAWEERAKQLFIVSRRDSYIIDDENGWHGFPGCWIGHNRYNQKLLLLVPAQSSLSKQQQQDFINYSQQIAERSNIKKKIEAVIFAFKENRDEENSDKNITKQGLMDGLYEFTINLFGRNETIDIVYETENSLLDKLVDFSNYEREITKRVKEIRLPESNDRDKLTVNDVYVPSQYLYESTIGDKEKSQETVENHLQQWLNQSKREQITLLGEYGQGKSTATLMLTYNLIKEKFYRIPILIELRGKTPKNECQNPVKFLSAWGTPYKMEGKALGILHETGRLLLIFEGFDEMELSVNQTREQHFSRLWSFDHSQAKLLFTGRSNFFFDDEEEAYNLRLKEKYQDQGSIGKRIWLASFDIEKIKASLSAYKNQSMKTEIINLANHNERFLDIISRPSLLHVVASIWEEEKLGSQVNFITSAKIMKKFIKRTYDREVDKVEGYPKYQMLKRYERDYFMRGIASYMVAKDLKNQINEEDLDNLIENLFNKIPEFKTREGLLEERIKQRELKHNEAIKVIQADVRAFGLLVQDLSTANTFKFGHKSFMEFLFADTIFEFINNEESKVSASILQVTDAQIKDLLKVPVSIDFVAELFGTSSTIQSSDTNSDDQIQAKYKTANRLLSAIIGYKKIHFLRLGLLFKGLMWTLSNRLWRKNISVIFFNSISVWATIGMFFVFLSYSYNLYRHKYFVIPFHLFRFEVSAFIHLFQILCLIFLLSYELAIVYSIFIFSKRYYKEIILWIKLCKKLKIDDFTLHKVAGTSRFSWSNDEPLENIVNFILNL
ncbi:NACHT domain-containing protein [Crocosphaera sp.]|uniref:NACHT domain-containing protein n=1 Tax=Crocosphaera sp. TaxID=2729996 RepID=UPI003F210409|nr:hypothetical protein [Crocosphaera sp.]